MNWLPLTLAPDRFEVSDHGHVRRIGGRPLKPAKDRRGHMYLRLMIKGRRRKVFIHRAVALAFLPKEPRRPVVDHRDGNKEHNKVENLRWSSHAANTRNAVATGAHKPGKPARPIYAECEAGIGLVFPSMSAGERHFAGRRTGEVCRAIADNRRAYGHVWGFVEEVKNG